MARTAKRGFHYQSRTADDVKGRAAGSGYDTFIKPKYKRYKIKDGKNNIRILPATWEGANHYGFDVWLNYGIGPDNNSFLSLSKHGKGKDPIAEARLEAKADDDEELDKQLKPRQRILMWVIDRQDEDEGPQIMDAPVSVDKGFADVSFDEDTGEIVPLDHPTRGCDVRFYRTGKGLNTKYEGSKIRLQKPSRISEDAEQQQQWLDFITENPLPDCLNFYDYDYISQVFNGSVKSRKDDDDEEDDVKTRKSSTKARHDEDDEDDEPKRKKPPFDEDEDESSDDDEDDAPPPKAKSKKKPSRDDDEDEPDTDDDENDEPTPKRRKKPVDDEDDEPAPRKKAKRPADDDDEDDEPAPRKRVKARAEPDDDDEEEDAPPPKKGGSLRDKIKSRKRSSESDDD
jgi:hypothetical protein